MKHGRDDERHRSSLTAVPPGAPGDAGDTHVPAAPDGRDGKQPERSAAHTPRPAPGGEPLKPALGAEASGAVGAGTGTDRGPGPSATPVTAPGAGDAEPRAAQLLPQPEREQLAQRLQHAMTGFVDAPRRAVEEAADVLQDTGDRLTAALAECRRSLGEEWRHEENTEELRLALRAYREVTERLLRT